MPAPRRTSAGTAVVVGIVVVVLGLTAVVLASRRLPGDRTAAAYSAALDDRVLFWLFAVLVVAATALVIWSAWPDGKQKVDEPPRSWWRQYAVSLVVLLLCVLAGLARDRVLRDGEQGDPGFLTPIERKGADGAGDEGGRLPASGTATLAMGLVIVCVIVASGGVRLARRRAEALAAGEPALASGGAHERLVEAIPETLDEADIAAEPDPRRGVQLAYALLERRLGGTPAARPAAATPQEWQAVLVRARRGGPSGSGAAARRLTVLYERARFADERHSVTSADQREAIEALQTLTQALAEPSTSSGGRGL